jgi:hypothetical protein
VFEEGEPVMINPKAAIHGDHRSRVSSVWGLLIAIALAVATPGVQAQAQDAKSILKAMSDYVASQKSIEFTGSRPHIRPRGEHAACPGG